MQKDPLIRLVDANAVRRQLQRRGAAHIDGHPLWQEARHRMRDRLSYIRCEDGPVLDHSLAHYGLPTNLTPQSWQRIESVGLLSALADVRGTLTAWAQSLQPGGLLMFVTLGPDSFRALALALGDAEQVCHVAGYPDMHDIGDALVGLKMTNPVMDAEWIRLTYSTPESALADLRALGGNALWGRPAGLSGRGWRARVLTALESLRRDDAITIEVELVFGHAWAAMPRSDQKSGGESAVKPVTLHPRMPKNASGSI